MPLMRLPLPPARPVEPFVSLPSLYMNTAVILHQSRAGTSAGRAPDECLALATPRGGWFLFTAAIATLPLVLLRKEAQRQRHDFDY